MTSQFIEQVQILMHAQQIKCAENVFGKSNYRWLSNRKSTFIWISTKDEFLIRQALNKLNQEQKIKVMKQLLTWLDEHPNAHSLKIPEMCINFLHNLNTSNAVTEVTLTRMQSFRRSLRRFSIRSNKVEPGSLLIPTSQVRPRRSVTFNDNVYCIKY